MDQGSSILNSPLFRKLTPYILYIATLAIGLTILFTGRVDGLFAMPQPGMDQLSMLQAAVGICRGILPPEGYFYSSAYTLFLAGLVKLCNGDMLSMRAVQCAICALIPVMIYQTALRLRFKRDAALAGAMLYIFYGPAQLIALDFLRAAPLGLCFISAVYFMADATLRRSLPRFALAGALAGICILGRENFIPVVLAPGLLLLHRGIRSHVGWKGASLYLAAMLAVVIAMVLLSRGHFGSYMVKPLESVRVMGYYHSAPRTPLLTALERLPMQAWRFLCSYEIPNSFSFYAHREFIEMLKVLAIPFNALSALSLAGLILGFRKPGVQLLALLAAIYAGSILLFLIFYRYRIPDLPLICTLAGFGLVELFNKTHSQKMRIATAVVAAALFLATWQNPDLQRTPQERSSVVGIMIMNGHFGKAASLIEGMQRDGIDTKRLKAQLAFAIATEEQQLRQQAQPSATPAQKSN